ncbi:chromosome segregation ATPase [Elusimicrobium simillimum]|uniref:hypothetical protein n=1 Tax=Elusimicrobium simillimum TaxID=3143438 RepID=UPI003C6EC104
MDLENNENLPSDISQFLDQFEKENSELERAFASGKSNFYNTIEPKTPSAKPEEKDQSFKKLEEKISELEQKFESSIKDRDQLMDELAKSKAENENSKSKDEFFNNISATIANLKESVDRLNRAQQQPQRTAFMPPTEIYGQGYYYGAPIDQASKFGAEQLYRAHQEVERYSKELFDAKEDSVTKQNIIEKQREDLEIQSQLANTQKQELAQHKIDKEEKERFIASLKEKTSRLKAVNSALEKEFKRVQDEKIEALRKSAEQAKEILSLRDQLTKAEERFKSFDFEGRIISIKNHYQQKVSKLETQLQEMSALCMKQVEEIEGLKLENTRLQAAQEESAALQTQLEEKNRQIEQFKKDLEALTKANEEALAKVKTEVASEANLELTGKIKAIEESASSKLKQKEDEAAAALKQKEFEIAKNAAQKIRAITQEANDKITALNAKILEVQKERDDIAVRLTAASSASSAADSAEKKRVDDTFKSLMQKIQDNDGVIESLKKKIEVLDSENKNLKKPAKKAEPSVELSKAAPEEIVPVKEAPAAPASTDLKYPDPAKRAAPTRAKAAALGDEYGGKKDFLEDTQTFFGRMKWSLLKED